jgi:hypothetical protein
MHDLPAFTKEDKAAIADAYELLRSLTKPGYSWSIVNWKQIEDGQGNDRKPSRRDLHDAAVEYVIALLDPAKPKNSDQAKTYDNGAQQRAADELLGVDAPIVRKVVLPALRLRAPPGRKGSRAPKRKGPRGIFAKRYIAAVVKTICQRYKRDPHRNPLSKHRHNGCAIVAEALNQLEIGLTESSVRQIYGKHR